MSNHPIFLDNDTLTSQILPTTSPPPDIAEKSNPQELQSQLSMVPKSLRPYLSDSCRR